MWRTLAILVSVAVSAWPQVLLGGDDAVSPAAQFLVVRLSAEAFAAFADRPIHRVAKVNDEILGTQVVGSSLFAGQLQVQLTENPQQAGFDVVLTGTTRSRTNGYNGPVVLHSHSSTQFRAVKHVVFEPQECFRAGPASVEAETQTVTDDIEPNRDGLVGRIIRRRAWEAVAARRTESQRIVCDKTKRRIAQLFDEYLADRLDAINRGVAVREVVSLLQASGLNPEFAGCTSPDCLWIAAGRGSCDLSCLDLPRLDRAKAPIEVWIQPVAIAGSVGQAVAPTVRSTKGILRWFDRMQSPALMEVAGLLATGSNATRSFPLQLDAAGDWIVFQFGEPAPELVAQRRR